ncbi:hypothetical protein [Paenibacillus monticola]|uniref:Uncharacterized protein n=1 Tax=Paenibacillus monticola TaxID=2666075 RepID=A0A7X2L4D6_9BACL|nr:hypothetical protein [Paenibacillus monticola]MRN56932.1 hypothetical protein [Paenibacillus monticola]
MNTGTLDERAEKMEENKTFSKSSLLRYRFLSSIHIILGYVIMMGSLYYSGVKFIIPVFIGACIGSLIGTFIRKPVRRNSRSRMIPTLSLTILTILICAIVFMRSTEDTSIKVIVSILIVLSIVVSHIIENKLVDKLWNDNTTRM